MTHYSFPRNALALIRCPACSGSLEAADFEKGPVTCTGCPRDFDIQDGILRLLQSDALTADSERERSARDAQALAAPKPSSHVVLEDPHQAMEMLPTLESLHLRSTDVVLELGCGDGRYSELISGEHRTVIAVDFSIEALRQMRNKTVAAGGTVAPVLASVTDFAVTPRAFDVVFCTLTSNLPDALQRGLLYSLASGALKLGGRFVFSVHHHGIMERLRKVPQSGHYEDGGIYRYNFTVKDLRDEVGRVFASCRVSFIRIYVPLTGLLRLPRVQVSRIAEHIPGINRLAQLLLCEACRPRRP